jgi:hypothetical protein
MAASRWLDQRPDDLERDQQDDDLLEDLTAALRGVAEGCSWTFHSVASFRAIPSWNGRRWNRSTASR